MAETAEKPETAESPDSRQLDDLELAAWRGMLFAYRNMTAAIDERLEREHGLALSSYEVLLLLSRAPENSLRMGNLADLLLLSRSGLTRLVDRLAARGLVERHTCSSDRRGTFARLTEAGCEAFERARPTNLAGIREQFVSRLDLDDLEDLARVWDRLDAGEPPDGGDAACG
jgi:DNA-binding MarR family transcriptional regulator